MLIDGQADVLLVAGTMTWLDGHDLSARAGRQTLHERP